MDEKKKTRSDSKLDSMPEHRILELRDRLLANEKHASLLAWLAVDCGVIVAASALTTFYRRHCWPVKRDRRLLAVAKSESIGEAMKKDPTRWDLATADIVMQRLFEWIDADDKDDPEALAKVLDSITKARKQDFHEKAKTKDQELEERKLAITEAKAAERDAAKGVLEEELTPEEKQQRLKQIFGMG